MLLRFLVYCSLGIDSAAKQHFFAAALCFMTPFAGANGMWLASLAGIIFLAQALYIEGAIAIGLVVFNVVGNAVLNKPKVRPENRE